MRDRFHVTATISAVIVVIGCVTGVGAATGQSPAARPLNPNQTASSKALPATLPSKQPVLLVRTVALSALPATMVTLAAAPPGYDVQRPVLTNPAPALVVTRSGVLQPGYALCPIFTDRVDLKPLMRNRYHLHGVRLTRYGSAAFVAASAAPLSFSGLDAAGNVLPQDALFESYVSLVIRAQALGGVSDLPGVPRPCSSGYRLSLTARGPRGVDPLSGAKVRF